MYDLLTANTGVALLSHGGNVYSTLDITGIYGLQKPFQAKSGPYVYATLQDPGRFEQRDYDKNDFQFGAEAKYQIGLRISKGNYLHLHLGIRLMSDYEGDWYLKSELDEWKEHPNSLKPQTTHKAGLRSDNVAFEGPSFYFGIGWDNGFTSPTE